MTYIQMSVVEFIVCIYNYTCLFLFLRFYLHQECAHACVYLLITMYTCTKNLHLCQYVYLLITMYWFDVPKICIFISMFVLKNILGLAFSFASILIPEVDYLNYFKSICYGLLMNGFLLFLTNIKQTQFSFIPNKYNVGIVL